MTPMVKCPKCGGNAELHNWGSIVDNDYADFHVECEKCGYYGNGSTEPQKAVEMFLNGTGYEYDNERWIKWMYTEELAELLLNVAYCCGLCLDGGHPKEKGLCENTNTNYCIFDDKESTIKWLKEKHEH